MGGFRGFWGVVPVFGGGVSYPKRVWGRLGAGFWFSGRAKADSRMWLSVLGVLGGWPSGCHPVSGGLGGRIRPGGGGWLLAVWFFVVVEVVGLAQIVSD